MVTVTRVSLRHDEFGKTWSRPRSRLRSDVASLLQLSVGARNEEADVLNRELTVTPHDFLQTDKHKQKTNKQSCGVIPLVSACS